MRRVPIGFKLAGALAAPLLGLLAVTVIEVTQTSRAVGDVRSQTDLATTTIGPTGVTSALQDERSWAVAELIGAQNDVSLTVTGYDETRQGTDEAIERFRSDIADKGDEIAAAYQPALDGLERLAALRDDIEANQYPRTINNATFADEIFRRYAELIQPFLDANSRVAVAIDNPELRTGAELIDASSRQIETLAALARVLLTSTLNNGLDQRVEIAEAAGLKDTFERNRDVIQATAREPYRTVVVEDFPDTVTTELISVADVAVSGGAYDVTRVLDAIDVPPEESYIGFRDKVAAALRREADDLDAAADTQVLLFGTLASAVLVIALVAMWLVARSITRPLHSLTHQATDMANQRLPDAVLDILDTPMGDDVTVPNVDPVTVRTRDEVADVADALNTVQDSALDLAVEQAVLRRNIADSFVNLGRRNQNLLGRQLDFITELEHNETDPDTLSNLFRLDHLATRMRRNAESLLVLAGIDPPRKWAAPVRITDAIRAALGEVEDYQRVTVRAVEPATILGSAAADLAHLMAELIENALIFSPPDQTVEIRGRVQAGPAPTSESPDRPPSSHRYGYTLAIIDSGLGMPPEELSRANRRLAGAESFTIAPSKYLGHYVAGNLAARHNINVQLHNSPGHGITATINLPPALLTAEPQVAPADSAGDADAAPGAPELPTEAPVLVPTPDPEERRAPAEPVAPAAAPAPVAQTSSGLAKRSRAPGGPATIPTQPGRTQPLTPSPDLIEALAKHTTGLHTDPSPGSPARPAPPGQPPLRPAARSGPASSMPAPPASGTSGPPPPPGPLAPPTQRPSQAAPWAAPAPRDPARSGREAPGPSPEPRYAPEPGPLAGLQSWADGRDLRSWTDHRPAEPPAPDQAAAPMAPLPRRPTSPATPRRPRDLQGGAPLTPQRAPFPPEPPSLPTLIPRERFSPGAAPPAEPPLVPLDGVGSPPPASADQLPPPTSGGLARRVRGAQMPTTEPRAMRRNHGGPTRPRPRDEPGRRPPTSQTSDTNGDHRAADEVYSFLSSFTAGVQRGLDESGKPGEGENPGDDG